MKDGCRPDAETYQYVAADSDDVGERRDRQYRATLNATHTNREEFVRSMPGFHGESSHLSVDL